MNLFDLMAKISLDKSEYEKGLDESEKEAESFGSKLKSGLGTAAKVGKVALGTVAAGATAVTTALVKGASDTAAYGDKIDKMSQKMGISAEAYQEWDAILQHSGSSIDGMQKGMMTLANAAATGSDAFEKLGLSQEDVASMSQEELFAATITGLQGMEEGTERAALAQKLLGGAAKELGPLLNTSAEETEEMRKRVHDLGGVMSNEAVKAAAKYQDSAQDMQTTIDGMKNSLFATFMPGVTDVMNGLTAIFSGDTEGGVGKIKDGINNIITVINEGMPQFIQVGGQIISGLMEAISANLPSIIQQGAQILLQLVVGIVEQLPALIEMAPEIISGLVTALLDATPALLAAGGKILEAIWDGIKSGWESLKEWFGGIIDSIKGFFDFDFELPKIKLPHFGITPKGWKISDLLEGTIPKLGIDWYAKAYDNPYMFKQPTVMGFGDRAGGEIVYGHESLMRDIKDATGGKSITFNATINIGGDISNPKKTAQELMYEMKEIFDREAAAYGYGA